jgi:hypothetical protein
MNQPAPLTGILLQPENCQRAIPEESFPMNLLWISMTAM